LYEYIFKIFLEKLGCLEVDEEVLEYDLNEGEKLIIDKRHLVAMNEAVDLR
jgi:uncharacterized protein (AIM24 family)